MGFIRKAELTDCKLYILMSLDLAPTYGVVNARKIVQAVDADKDGKIRYDEFRAALVRVTAQEKESILIQAFNQLD